MEEMEVITVEQKIDDVLVDILQELEKADPGSAKREKLAKEAEGIFKVYLQKQKIIGEQEFKYADMEKQENDKKFEQELAKERFEFEKRNKELERELANARFEFEKQEKEREKRERDHHNTKILARQLFTS